MARFTLDDFARMIDHTYLKQNATEADMAKLCGEARDNHFAMVAINQTQVARCKRLLEGTDVHVGAAISFPLGQTTIASKVFDTRDAIANGADEIDYVVNITEIKAGNWDYVADEMAQIVAATHEQGKVCKVIFENCYLTDDEKIRLCEIASDVRIDFVKTSTGWGTGGATFDDIRLMRAHTDPAVSVKAAGGIRNADDFLEYVRLGCRRIGTSAGVDIIAGIAARMEVEESDIIEL